MDTILNIDNHDTKNVEISNESGMTGAIDFLSEKSDNNSYRSSPLNSPIMKQVAPQLSVSDSMGINFLESSNKPEEEPRSNDIHQSATNDNFMMNTEETEEFKPIHRMSGTEIKNEKIDYIYKFKKLGEQGIRTTMNYNMNSNLDEMRNEYLKLKKQREIDNSIKFQRKVLMAAVTGLEFMNNKIDPFSINLDGWSESVNDGIFDYDEIFEELYGKYGGGDSEIAPELRLVFALGSSAFMFHLQNTMFKSSLPGMDDILKQNPELMKQFASAAVGSMNAPGGGGAPPGMAGMMRGMGMMGGPPGMGGPGGQPRRPPSPQRPDMDGPDGLDDIIKTMNLEPDNLPDLDNISLISGDTDRRSGITLNL